MRIIYKTIEIWSQAISAYGFTAYVFNPSGYFVLLHTIMFSEGFYFRWDTIHLMKQSLEEKLGSRLSSRGLFIYAKTFYHSFSELVRIDSHTTQFHPVQYYLASHSLELSMKSLLRELGYTYDQLINLGHDLEKIFNEVQQSNSIEFTDTEVEVIKFLNVHYSVKELEYFIRGYKEFPDLLITDIVVLGVLTKIEPKVGAHI